MARLYMDNGRDQDAVNILQTIVINQPDSELALVAKLRLARIYIYQDRPEAVLDLIENASESSFSWRFQEVLGDAYVMLEMFDKAESAYFSALTSDSSMVPESQALIQLKINDLPYIEAIKEDTADDPNAGTKIESGS